MIVWTLHGDRIEEAAVADRIAAAAASAATDGTLYAYVAVQRPPTVAGQAHSLLNFAASLEDMRIKLEDQGSQWHTHHCYPVSLNDGLMGPLATALRHGGVHSLVWCASGFGWQAPSDNNLDLDALCNLLRDPKVSAPALVRQCRLPL